MSILADENTKIVILGITGREAANTSREMQDYGAKVVAGVTPGKKGQNVHGIPVYNSVKEAVDKHGADAALISVPPAAAADAILECADAGIRLAVVLTERIPKRDVIRAVAFSQSRGMIIIGPNSPGIISPGKTRIGYLGGSNPERAFRAGNVGVVSRSGGMTTEMANLLSLNGIGISTAIGMGGDPVVGSTYLDYFPLFEEDAETKAVVLYCEPGGSKEEALAQWIPSNFTKPVVAFIGGKFVDKMPGTRFGHASVIVQAGSGTTEEKTKSFKKVGVVVVEKYSDIPEAVRTVLGKK